MKLLKSSIIAWGIVGIFSNMLAHLENALLPEDERRDWEEFAKGNLARTLIGPVILPDQAMNLLDLMNKRGMLI